MREHEPRFTLRISMTADAADSIARMLADHAEDPELWAIGVVLRAHALEARAPWLDTGAPR